MRAADRGELARVESMLKERQDPDLPSRSGFTALTAAIRSHRAEVVELLLKAGASMDVEGYNDQMVSRVS